MISHNYHDQTRAVHGGLFIDPHSGSVAPIITPTTTFKQASPGEPLGPYDYARAGNPTRDQLEKALASTEKTTYALAFASGLAATHTLMQLASPRATILVCDDVYGGTRRLFQRICQRCQDLNFVFVDMTDQAQIEKAIDQHSPYLAWVETPTNPTLRIIDLEAISMLCRRSNTFLVVDNTFASPIFQSPIEFGADLIVHSSTKYLGGHSDVTGGVIMTSHEELHEKLRFFQMAIGSVPSAFDNYLLLRSLQTLAIRMNQHSHNATAVAEYLDDHPRVEKVLYPGLPSYPQYSIALKQMKNFSGMVSFYLRGSSDDVQKFCSQLELFTLAESLGSTKSLINHPATMTHASVPADIRRELGISAQLLRLSIGLEYQEDLITDLERALKGL